MLASEVFVLPLPDLLFDLLCDQVNGGVKIAFNIFGEKIGTGKGKTKRAGELLVRGFSLVMFQNHTGVDRIAVQVRQLLYSGDDVIFDGFGEGYVVRRKDQVHVVSMGSGSIKIQRNLIKIATTGRDDFHVVPNLPLVLKTKEVGSENLGRRGSRPYQLTGSAAARNWHWRN
jgi:hypothetical protein